MLTAIPHQYFTKGACLLHVTVVLQPSGSSKNSSGGQEGSAMECGDIRWVTGGDTRPPDCTTVDCQVIMKDLYSFQIDAFKLSSLFHMTCC